MASEDIPYFKIKYSFMATWTIREATYLLLGVRPRQLVFNEMSPDSPDKFSIFHYWLKQKIKEGKITPTVGGSGSGLRFEPSQFFSCLKAEDKKYDEDIEKIINSRFSKNPSAQIQSRIYRALYKEAARILWEKHKSLRIPDMAELLTALPGHLNDFYPIDKRQHDVVTIREYLKGMSPHELGAPRKSEKESVDVDWGYVVERMVKINEEDFDEFPDISPFFEP